MLQRSIWFMDHSVHRFGAIHHLVIIQEHGCNRKCCIWLEIQTRTSESGHQPDRLLSHTVFDSGSSCTHLGFLFFVCTTGKPTGYGPNSRRLHNRGIVDECCFQSCELKRLEMYCAPVKSGKAPRSVREQRHTDTPKTPKVSFSSTGSSSQIWKK